ncbi:unnamed protein product [Peniophora sp. CBMAI 1063]|nr:unnamed protein product [Peniophora sp. CBMAI 1063]
MLKAFTALVALSTGASAAQQWTAGDTYGWTAPDRAASSYHGFAGPVGALSNVRGDGYTTFSHPLFPEYSARIKESRWCDSGVKTYTGYIDIAARHLFFSFFESRNDPDKDDVLFWTNGGPGCSSSVGLLMELGPCRVTNATGEPKRHEYAWNERANVFFIDQPVNVGFSYAEYGETVYTSEEAAVDIAKFVFLFFENFPQFKGRSFHMAGESFGGRYIPLFSAAVYDQNALLVENGFDPINLTSAIIGNGMTDRYRITLSKYDIVCTSASLPPVLPIETCVRMKKAVPRCEKLLQASCVDQFDSMGCEAAAAFCNTEIGLPFALSGLNVYDISKPCIGTLCYPVMDEITGYLSRPDVREILGVDPAVPASFQACNMEVNAGFALNDDGLHDSTAHVAALLERGVKVLVYVGTYDWGCNFVGNQRFVQALEWTGHDAFNAAEDRAWIVDGEVAGKTRSAAGLTFATVDAAGHMVPYDKPKQGLAMINRWLNGTSL